MFSTILAWAAFIITSILLLIIIVDVVWPKSKHQQAAELLQAYVQGYRTVTDWRKVGILILIWAASGIYLWG